MPLSVDTRKIIKAEVVWEKLEGMHGVAYETNDGWHGADPIGTKAQAHKIVRDIATQRAIALNTTLDRSDG